jgi:hypothetical protein
MKKKLIFIKINKKFIMISNSIVILRSTNFDWIVFVRYVGFCSGSRPDFFVINIFLHSKKKWSTQYAFEIQGGMYFKIVQKYAIRVLFFVKKGTRNFTKVAYKNVYLNVYFFFPYKNGPKYTVRVQNAYSREQYVKGARDLNPMCQY